MCGIAGIFAYRPLVAPVSVDELLRMRDSMARRGPDGAGQWLSPDGRIGLAHRRLAIIDLSDAAAQPMSAREGRLWITFNGEIYNYRALKRDLEARGRRFRTASDTEVLLHLYDEHGPAMLGMLRGMFAFAIWDDDAKSLFLARDPFGIKPLYYADEKGTFRFASQVKGLIAGGAVSGEHDVAGQVGFLTWGFVPEPFTIHRAIHALPAGTWLRIDALGGRHEQRYFNVRDEFREAEERARANAGDARHAGRAIEALADSVRRHMVSDVPVAAFLSAGLDSSTTVALATRVAGGDLRTLTLGFREYQGTENDETARAALVASRFAAKHETRWVTRDDFEAEVGAIFEVMDQPTTDGVNTYFVSKAAAGAGMKVALSGLGGDEIFAGYPSFRHVPRMRKLVAASHMSTRMGAALRRIASPVLRRFTSPKYAGLFEYGGSAAGAYLLRRGLFLPWELPDVMDAELAAEGWQQLNALEMLRQDVAGLRDDHSIVSTLELDWYMRNQLLRDSDWAGMAHSVEIRVPYVDVDFFRTAASLVLGKNDLGKLDLARALDTPLPDEILAQPKQGFLVPVQQWCTAMAGNEHPDRGLRGWARVVMAHQVGIPGLEVGRPPRSARKRVAASLASVSYTMVNAALQATSAVLWPRPRPRDARRVCIFRIGNIGDIVCALPAMHAIRDAYPDAHITLLTSPGARGMPGAAELLQGVDWLDELRVYYSEDIDTHQKRAQLLRNLRAERFDVWVDLPNNLTTISRQFRDMAFARMTGARWARGWRIDTLRWAAQAQSEYLRFPNEVERMLGIVRAIGLPRRRVEFGLPRTQAANERIDQLLRTHGLDAKKLVAIAPGGKRTTNLWRPERFAAVAEELQRLSYQVVLLGGRPEAALCDDIAGRMGSGTRSFAGTLSVLESCELVRRCRLAICVDSGVQHIAAAVGTPVVSLFSFWQMRGKWRPYGTDNVVLQKWVGCHTCLLDECPNQNRCTNAIRVSEVVVHARRLLQRGRRDEAPAWPEAANRETRIQREAIVASKR